MKISLKWLSEFIAIQDLTPQELAYKLTMSGLEVSSLENKAAGLERVVVGRLQKVERHPNADKLSITEVEIPGQILRIVCGAKNIAPGDVVPIALEGAQLPNGLTISRAKIRGEESCGMICSETELGLAEKSEGIMHLPAETPLGMPFAQAMKLDDTILEIEITPNRADCLSHLGIARHLSGILDRPLTLPALDLNEIDPAAAGQIKINIHAQSGCRRYCARIIRQVNIGPSPNWLQVRLKHLGIRPINNVVDITNLVLMETGHPLHAFDYDQLQGNEINVRRANADETIVTLDGISRPLSSEDLVIADAKSPVALAGVMGGQFSEVTDKTQNILLEAAWFDPRIVRKMVRRTGCASESSFRFERGADPETGLLLAIDRAASYIAMLAGGKIAKGIVNNYPEKFTPQRITLRLPRIEGILGLTLDPSQTLRSLSRIGFLCEPVDQPNVFSVHVPSYRHDIAIEEDLAEEIAEIIGYDKIPATPQRVPMICPVADDKQLFQQKVRECCVGAGLNEVINYSFHGPSHYQALRLPADHVWRNALIIKNPLSEELSRLRTSLCFGLLESLSYNQRRGQERIHLFEISAVYLPETIGQQPREPKHLGIALSGQSLEPFWNQGKNNPVVDFFNLKGIINGILERLHYTQPIQYLPATHPFLHPLVNFRLVNAAGHELGWVGRLHPECQENYKLKDAVWAAEIDLEVIQTHWSKQPTLKKFSRFPASLRDIAIGVPKEIPAGDIIQAIHQQGGDMVLQVTLFDVYQGPELDPSIKSLAFSLTFQAFDRTLKDEEINQLQEKIINHLSERFNARQR